jgi:type II secretory pathway pseudopilin PulG
MKSCIRYSRSKRRAAKLQGVSAIGGVSNYKAEPSVILSQNMSRFGTLAFTMVEVVVVMALLAVLVTAVFGEILSLRVMARRTAEMISGVELAEAEIHNIRAMDYPGTNGFFSFTQTTTNISSVSLSLNEAATSFNIPGTVIATAAPITWGHLVTVTVIFSQTNDPVTNCIQTVVNAYSGGRGD